MTDEPEIEKCVCGRNAKLVTAYYDGDIIFVTCDTQPELPSCWAGPMGDTPADAAEGVHRARLASEMCIEEDGPRHQMLLAAVRVAERAYRATGSPGVELLDDVEEQRWQLATAEEEIEVRGFELLRTMEKTEAV